MLSSKLGAIGRYAASPAFCSSTSGAIRSRLARTSSLGDHAVAQPVGQQLARDAQGGAVLHERHVVDVGHLRAADARGRSSAPRSPGWTGSCCRPPRGSPRAPRPVPWPAGWSAARRWWCASCPPSSSCTAHDVDLVVVHRVQGGRGRRGHPRGGGAGAGLADLLLDHVGHQLGHGPHALADLGLAGEPGGKPGVDVVRPRRPGSTAGSSSHPCGPSGRPPSRCGSRRRCGPGSRC